MRARVLCRQTGTRASRQRVASMGPRTVVRYHRLIVGFDVCCYRLRKESRPANLAGFLGNSRVVRGGRDGRGGEDVEAASRVGIGMSSPSREH